MSDEININGRCHCGQIEIGARIKKSEVRACHCTDCQKISGAPFRAIAVASLENFKIKGIPKEYVKVADSGNKRIQAFCENCGTQLFATDSNRKIFNIRTGFLEQREVLEPKKHVFTKSSMGWLKNIGPT